MADTEILALDVIQLARDRTCTKCPLHEGVNEICIPTTLYGGVRNHKRALLIVGEAPGLTEDKKGQPFVGAAGYTLKRLYIDYFKLHLLADVWLGNAVRCHPPGNKTPTKTQLKSCQGFLLADIARLQREYDEVLVLCVGAPAVASVIGGSLRQSFHRQGDFSDFRKLIKGQEKYLKLFEGDYPEPVRVFSTYHPSYLNRDPSMGLAVKAHIQMLVDSMNGVLEYEMPELLEISIAPMPPKYDFPRLSLDIETYGIVMGHPKQTMFHPLKSVAHDHTTKEDMVQTVGLSWRYPSSLCFGPSVLGNMKHAIFYMDNVEHRRRLWAWIRKCQKNKNFEFLLGQNITFDITYLRFCYKEARLLLDDPLPIMDLIVLNYLHDESRPEKSLKALAPLFRVTKYSGEFIRYPDVRDPLLAQYNCQDTGATLRLAEKLEDEIRGFYGKNTKKLSKFCMEWYSQLLWLIIWMSDDGLKMDRPRLLNLFDKYMHALTAILKHAQDKYSAPLRGLGSNKAKQTAMSEAVGWIETWKGKVPELKLTDSKKEISFCAENRNILMEAMREGKEVPQENEYKLLKLMGSYQDVAGILDRYLYPLLQGRGKKHDIRDTVLIDGFIYPRWFPVPSEFEDSSTGGTKQARIVAKGPAIQTFPPPIKRTIQGRFPGGYLIWFDYSQIELRIAALLSNDDVMMEAYQGKPDLHGDTAKMIFGDDIVNHPAYRSIYRQAGKVLNFLVLYRGGAQKFHETLIREVGIDYPIEKCVSAINDFRRKHRGLIKWQDGLFDFVMQHGYYELPLIGQSRLFLGGRKAKEKAINEIVNLPVQALAADVMLSAQYSLWSRFKQVGLKAVVPCNIYDAALIECPKNELYRVEKVMEEILPNPLFYQYLCTELGRTLPLEYDVSTTLVLA